MALCNVTGTVYLPNGDVASRREVVFYKLPDNVTADYLGAVVPEPIIVRTDSAGELDVNLITGNYYGHVQSRSGKEKYPFRAIVPESATADFADLITAVDPVEPLPAWLQQALQARDEAVQAADDAEAIVGGLGSLTQAVDDAEAAAVSSAQSALDAAASAALSAVAVNESPQSWSDFSNYMDYQDGKVLAYNGVLFVRDSAAAIAGLGAGDGWAPFGLVTPEHFMAVGDGVSDDTLALRAMTSYNGSRIYAPRSDRRYVTHGQLDFGRESLWVTPLNLHVVGPRNAPDASLGVQTGGGGQHLAVIFAQGNHSGESINITSEPDASFPWLAMISNDFYLISNGQRPSYVTNFSFRKVSISSSSYTKGYTGDGNAAIRFQAMDCVSIDRLFSDNFERAYLHSDVTHSEIGGKLLRINRFRSGAQISRSETCSIGNVFAYGHPTDKEYSPGSNAIVVRAVERFSCGNVYAKDCGEHGVRITSQYGTVGAFGLVGRDIFTNAVFGDVGVYRPGGCGFKADSGSASPETRAPIGSVSIRNLTVIDAGTQDYDTGGTFTGENHFGLNLQIVNSFTCGTYTSRKSQSLYNGRNIILMRNVSNVLIGSLTGGDCYGDAIFWNNEDVDNYNVSINSGSVYSYGADGTGRAIHILNGARVGRVTLNVNMSNGPRGVRLAGESVGTPLNFWSITGTFFSVPGLLVDASQTARTRISLKTASVESSSTSDEYSTGISIMCRGEAGANSVNRGAIADVYLDPSASRSYIAVASGATPTLPVGAKLSGVWRGRGQSGDGLMVFVEKVWM